MGCKLTTVQSVAPTGCSAPSPPSLDSSHVWITHRQRKHIQVTWQRLVPAETDYEQIGADVFLRIFTRHPQLLALFPFGVGIDIDSSTDDEEVIRAKLEIVRQHPAFRNHAAAFVTAIGLAVESIDDWDGELTATLIQLGAMHSETQGFTIDNFEVFVESLLHVWKTRLDECRMDGANDDDVMHAWESLFIFMMMKLRDGYQMARQQPRSMSTFSDR